MARVLRPGGRLALTAWCPPERSPYLCLVMGAVRELGRTETDLPAGPPPYQMGEPERICAALSAAGLGGCETRELDVWVEAESADGVLAPLMEGGVRTRKLLLAQASAALKRIEAAVAERAEAFRHGDVIRIARPALLAVATQPR